MTSTTHTGSTVERMTDALRRASAGVGHAALRHRLSFFWLSPTLLIAAVATGLNSAGAPARVDAEGTFTAEAFAVSQFGEVTRYVNSYEHPPLGWIQLAGYDQLTGAFDRYASAVLAGREAMIVLAIVSALLLWGLARRLELSRPAAAAAALIFALSPLAVQFHRSVYLDNVATPWLLAAFLLALARRHQPALFAASAACFGVAVLSKETFLLALPFLIWTMVRGTRSTGRTQPLWIAVQVLVLIGINAALLPLVNGELFPSDEKPSLIGGIAYQLWDRDSSGSILDPDSGISRTLQSWVLLDPVLVVLGLLAAVAGLAIERLRVFAALTLALAAVMFRPGGYLPDQYVIVLLPFGALLIAALTDRAVQLLRRGGEPWRSVVWTVAAGMALIVAVPVWTVELRQQFVRQPDAPLRAAEQWVDTNLARNQRLLVGDAAWVDLYRAGWARDDLVSSAALGVDPAVNGRYPGGWKDFDYIVATPSMRSSGSGAEAATRAIANSRAVASFGSGATAVQVRRIEPQGKLQARTDAATAVAARSEAGAQLAQNPGLRTSPGTGRLLITGRVDDRITLALGAGITATPIAVQSFPARDGESGPLRRVLITGFGDDPAAPNGRLSASATAFVASLTGDFAPLSARASGGGLLITYRPR